jgi:hypothetical protein
VSEFILQITPVLYISNVSEFILQITRVLYISNVSELIFTDTIHYIGVVRNCCNVSVDIPELVVPIRISLIEGCCKQGSY